MPPAVGIPAIRTPTVRAKMAGTQRQAPGHDGARGFTFEVATPYAWISGQPPSDSGRNAWSAGVVASSLYKSQGFARSADDFTWNR